MQHKRELIEQKQKDAKDMQDYIENEDRKMRQREREFEERLQKIQDKMNKMADTVVRNENEKRLKEERRLLQLQHDKEEREIREERERKIRAFEQNVQINKYLMDQMNQRQEQKQRDLQRDKELQHNLLEKNRRLKEQDDSKNAQYHEELRRNRDFVLKQAEDKRTAPKLEMDPREQKLNKDLLSSLKQRNMIW